MKYKNFELDDFLKDANFVQWVKSPNEESNQFWQSFLQLYPEKRAAMVQARDIITMLHYKEEHTLSDSEREQMIADYDRFDFHIHEPVNESFPFMKVAASILILMVLGATFWYVNYSNSQKKVVVQNTTNQPWMVKQTAKGQKMSFRLSDGTNVKLNSNTKCSFPSSFANKDLREFKIHYGEVFFDVTKDSTSPFVVYTNETATRVLGTSFNVRMDSTNKNLEIALLTGKIFVKNQLDKLYLTPGEMLNISANNMVKSEFDSLRVTGWKDGVLVIDELPFPKMISLLENWYGVTFDVASSVQTTGIFNGSFRNQPLENVLLGMGYTSEVNFKIENNKVYLK